MVSLDYTPQPCHALCNSTGGGGTSSFETTAAASLLIWPPNPLLRRLIHEKAPTLHHDRTSLSGAMGHAPAGVNSTIHGGNQIGSVAEAQNPLDALPVLLYPLQLPVDIEVLNYQVRICSHPCHIGMQKLWDALPYSPLCRSAPLRRPYLRTPIGQTNGHHQLRAGKAAWTHNLVMGMMNPVTMCRDLL